MGGMVELEDEVAGWGMVELVDEVAGWGEWSNWGWGCRMGGMVKLRMGLPGQGNGSKWINKVQGIGGILENKFFPIKFVPLPSLI